jgi:hypothetical protein
MGPGLATAKLDHLRRNWGVAYEITEALGVWRAVRADNQVSLLGSSAEDLRDQIVADYTRRRVPRP